MKLLFISLFVACAGRDIWTSINDGKPACDEQFPYQVGVRSNNIWCGGTLISEKFILTAAHCVNDIDAGSITVYLGSVKYQEGTKVNASHKIIHPDFHADTLLNDIALVGFYPITLSDSIRNVELPPLLDFNTLDSTMSDSVADYTGETVIATGWGGTGVGNQSVNILLFTEMVIINNKQCELGYKHGLIPDTNICAAADEQASVCNGDTGGPIVLEDSLLLVGITSYGPVDECQPDLGSVFTRITSYRQWIKDNAGV